MKILLIIAVLATLVACVSSQPLPPPEPPKHYYWKGAQPQPSTQQFQQDMAGCKQESRQVQALLSNRDLTTMYRIMAMELEGCMAVHGWEWRSEQAGNSGNTPIKSTPTVGKQPALTEEQLRREKEVRKEVDAFASDPAHPYFDEVADEMAPLIKNGMSLQEAYEKASMNCTTQRVGTQWVKKCP